MNIKILNTIIAIFGIAVGFILGRLDDIFTTAIVVVAVLAYLAFGNYTYRKNSVL